MSGAPSALVATWSPSAASGSPSAPSSADQASSRVPGTGAPTRIDDAVRPLKCSRYRRRPASAGPHPARVLSMAWSHSSPLPKPLLTTRTTHVPPAFASTRNSVAMRRGSAPWSGTQPSVS